MKIYEVQYTDCGTTQREFYSNKAEAKKRISRLEKVNDEYFSRGGDSLIIEDLFLYPMTHNIHPTKKSILEFLNDLYN